ncbi:hypothetical protein LS73_009595 [Helicobacter muridarum]|uniref:Uncharacterized protein n=1 Tax=Helicobacter muridarum TaxID=216 RepID=A0A099TYP8_9HELI|nr:hypothetical protein [Helicobacter muridarum]TLD97977.1 hypothetical protein LS73_009595 [Helicobacter muridarum]STQ86966.1 Uncharacterised protein [Helicobacter muridarum]
MPKYLIILFFIFSPFLYAYRCEEFSCSYFKLGIGASYSNFNFSNEVKVSNTGVYLAAFASKYWEWGGFGFNVDFGFTSTHINANAGLAK